MSKVVEVAAAVLIDADGRFLLAQRPARTFYAGYWEFPGGKVEPGETARQALVRELREEIGIEIQQADPWIVKTFSYPHAMVRLHFFRARQWQGEPQGREGQALAWQRPGDCNLAPVLPANAPIMRALELPTEYAISNAQSIGADNFIEHLRRRLSSGLRLLQLREKQMQLADFKHFAGRAIALAHQSNARVLINGSIELARELGADGVQWSAAEVAAATSRPDIALLGASAHNDVELRAAEALGADFAVLGSVYATPTHPDAVGMGWAAFAQRAVGCSIPVFAIGGLRPDGLTEAWTHGAHGIAMIRGSWT
jgi:8-oxo-dGTP diphosphatase